MMVSKNRIALNKHNRELAAARYQLSSTWGADEPHFTKIAGNHEKISEPPALASINKWLLQNPEIARQQTEIDLQNARLSLAKSAGVLSFTRLSIDTFPDISPNLVQVFAEVEGMAAEETEQFVTRPVEVTMRGIPGDLLSFGGIAIALGMIVDATIIMVERLQSAFAAESEKTSTGTLVLRAAQEVATPIFFASAIIIIVFLPIFTLGAVEGKMFRPLAIAVTATMVGAGSKHGG